MIKKKRKQTTQAEREKNREALKLLFPEIYEKANQEEKRKTGGERTQNNKA